MSRRMTTLKLSHKQPESRQMTHLLRVFLSYDNLVITLEQLNDNLKSSNDVPVTNLWHFPSRQMTRLWLVFVMCDYFMKIPRSSSDR